MLHTYVQRFDVTENLEKFCKILGTKQAHGLNRNRLDSWEMGKIRLVMNCKA